MTHRWPPRFAAFALWLLAALSATAWVLKILGSAEAPVDAGAITVPEPAVAVQDLARALGPDASPAAPSLAGTPLQQAQDPGARLRLLGVVAGRRSGGVALISVDGQLPRPYRVGSEIDAGYRLTGVAARSATLAPAQPGGPAITLELPAIDAQPGPAAAAQGARPPELARANPRPPLAAPAPSPAAAPAASPAPGVDSDEARKD